MTSQADTALLATNGGLLGYWVGGFVVSFLAGFILLRFAGSPKRAPHMATLLRIVAVSVVGFFAFAGFKGGGGQLVAAVGQLAAFSATLVWAIVQHLRSERRTETTQAK